MMTQTVRHTDIRNLERISYSCLQTILILLRWCKWKPSGINLLC